MLTQKDIRKNRKLLRDQDRELALTFKSIGDLNRFRIFRILAEVPLMSIGSIAAILEMSAPLTSQHVRVLESAQLLTKSRTGKIVYLQLNLENPIVEEIIRSIRRALKPRTLSKEKAQ